MLTSKIKSGEFKLEIWKSILLKNVAGTKFKNAKTIEDSDRNKKFQVFEVLITETLAIVDPNIEWHSLPVQGDDGVDFIGQVKQIDVPYIISKPNEVVLGQIKRRAGSYTKDHFHYDIIKIIEYYTQVYSQKSALFEIIHVLSTDKNVDSSKWLENITYPYVSYNILPVNAIDFLKFWKINSKFIQWQLEGIFTDEQLSPLLKYIDDLQENWEDLIHIDIKQDNHVRVDDEINIDISFSSTVDLALTLLVEWIPSDSNSDIVIIYPLNALKNSISRYSISVYRTFDLKMRLKALRSGEKDLGTLNIYSSSGELVSNFLLGKINVQAGIVNKFFSLPCQKQLQNIKGYLVSQKTKSYKALALIGQGGIGKSSFAQESALFAQNHGYYIVMAQNANDFNNSRNIVLDMLIKLLDSQTYGLISYENIHEGIRRKLGVNFSADWNESICKYIINDELTDGNLEKIAQCILTLLIIQTYVQPVFIWLSDMHWASKETIVLFQKLLNLLKLNQDYLSNNLFLIFEGRDSDTLKMEDEIIFPYKWLEFCESDEIEKCKLHTWSDEYSRDYIRMLVNPLNKPENLQMPELVELLLNYSAGNPMHIKELIHYMIECEDLLIDNDATLSLIHPHFHLKAEELGLRNIILKRLQFYHEKYSDIIDYYIILASISHNPQDIYKYVKRKLSKKYFSYPQLEKDIGILSDTKVEKLFLHEYYKDLLKELIINDEEILTDMLNYYERNREDSIDSKIDMIMLWMMREETEYAFIAKELTTLLTADLTDFQALKCYQLMLQIPQKHHEGLMVAEIYFEMSEIAIRIGSWKDSQKYLEQILALSHDKEVEDLYFILACKNLGNMYGVLLELDKSIEICKVGLNQVEKKIKRNVFEDPAMKEEFDRQYEMLLNRIAVTYWFAGQASVSAPFQEKALMLAKKRQDTYAIAHTLYETGMRQLHHDIYLGNRNIEQALKLLPEKGRYTELQERFLVRVELLISQLLIYEKEKEEKVLDSMLHESEELCVQLSMKTANYESALCYIVNGICYIFKEDFTTALTCFFKSLYCANLGEFQTLLWKIYFNIAETCLLLNQQKPDEFYADQAVKYAQCGLKILSHAMALNNNMLSYLQLVDTPYLYLKNIIERKTELHMTENAAEQKLIGVNYKNYCFYIMD